MKTNENGTYLGNPNLKAGRVKINFTKDQVSEYLKCKDDPEYFIENYIKIVHVDEGLIPFKMWKFQKKMVKTFHENRFTICKLPRQSGKSTTILSYLLHFVIFNDNKNVAILANRGDLARDLLSRLKMAYEYLPKWIQQGVITWNKGSIELENGSKIIATATSSSAARGGTYNIIFLDEFAHVGNNMANEFFNSVYPTISSGKTTKIMIVSTPFGMNLFYKLWTNAIEGKNKYIPIETSWRDIPGRDDKFKQETIANTSQEQWDQEFECNFIGSSGTLINANKLQTIPHKTPVYSKDSFDIYEIPDKSKFYAMVCDTAEGVQKDNSAFVVIDITQVPYNIVAKYANNEISPLGYPGVIEKVARLYNDASVLVEINSVGHQVANILHYDLEYENVMIVVSKNKKGQAVSGGFTKGIQLGIKTTAQVKQIGCRTLKDLIESDKIIINDFDLLSELSTFAAKGRSWEAEEGHTDDLVMCLVLFSWLVNQNYFKENLTHDLREKMYKEKMHQIDEDLSPFGFLSDGSPDNEVDIDSDGIAWQIDEDLSQIYRDMHGIG